jgi:hypothetical protein
MYPSGSESTLSTIGDRVRRFLIKLARDADPNRPFTATITYGRLREAIDPDQIYFKPPRCRGIGKVLGQISTYEHRQGHPMLSALVVQAGTLRAGDGFAVLGRSLGEQIQPGAELAFWRNQIEAVIRYWSLLGRNEPARDPVAKARALLATVRGELDEISRLLSIVYR